MQISYAKTGAPFRRFITTWVANLLVLVSGMGIAYAADVPDASKPGGAQAGREFRPPLPPPERLPLPRYKAEKKESMQNALTRIRVIQIQLQGVIDRPELGISVNDLLKLVEVLRREKMTTGISSPAAGEAPEKDSKLLNKIEKMAKEAGTEAEQRALEEVIKRFASPIATQDTLTIQQLQEIAASVAQYYRSRGVFLAQAFIPPQTVANGVIQIRVLEGILGNVSIEKNVHYSERQLLIPFHSLFGLPITRQKIEEAMLLLNDYPGLKSFAVFKPGTNMGEADLLVSVLQEERFATVAHVDNYGSTFTGGLRTRIDASINSPSGGIDRLNATLSKTFNPANGNYIALDYRRSAFGPKNTFGIGASRNTYNLGGSLKSLGIDGEITESQVSWRRAIHRSRLFNSYGLFQFKRKSAILNIEQGTGRADELSIARLEAGFDWSGANRKNLISSTVGFSQGYDGLFGAMEQTNDPTRSKASRRGGSGMYAGGKFGKMTFDYQHWLNVSREHTIHFSFNGQYSDDLLTSMEQFPIGGPNSVRAYGTSEYLRDKGISTSLEWLIKAPGFYDWPAFGNKRWGELLQVALFADYAEGTLNDPLASDIEYINLYGIGAGIRFNYKTISARLEVASPLSEEEASNNRDPQYYFEMNYGF